MQSLRSTSLRRLCLSLAKSAARPTRSSLLPVPSRCARPFTSVSPRWNSSAHQPPHRITEGDEETHKPLDSPTESEGRTGTLFVGNLPFTATEDDIREVFSGYGHLKRIAIATLRGGGPAGCAHIEFETERSVDAAIKDHEGFPTKIRGRTLRLEHASTHRTSRRNLGPSYHSGKRPSPTLFIGGAPPEATKEDFLQALVPLAKVLDIRIPTAGRGLAYVDFEDADEAEKVLMHHRDVHPVCVLGGEVRLDRASALQRPPSPRLYFSGWNGDAPSLRFHFRALMSRIVDLRFLPNSDPALPFLSGFIEFCDLETAGEAIARFAGPELKLSYARSKKLFGRRRPEPREVTVEGSLSVELKKQREQGDGNE